MAMSEALMIAAPLATGMSLATPKEYAPATSLLLAALSSGSGILGLLLTREGKTGAALVSSVASMIFGIFGMLKALEAI